VEGLSQKGVAARLGTSPTVANGLLYRARLALKWKLFRRIPEL